ncbi:MAG: hypothetical protein SXU28_04845, partial [Pseudomonadota bacterium]|nr:hypothetical protein [Pseudomonadota bacterium]
NAPIAQLDRVLPSEGCKEKEYLWIKSNIIRRLSILAFGVFPFNQHPVTTKNQMKSQDFSRSAAIIWTNSLIRL